MNKLIDQQLNAKRSQLDEVVKNLHELCIQIDQQELATTVSDLRIRIHDPFMFVIVGEVKSGKSSFVNALLDAGREITQAAPQPMTDTIQQIVYGEKEETIEINPYLKKIMIPVDILKEIAIVDTPGTNTIVEHHQEITESFIPASDLIVFVFEAKNPYRQSAWDFFNFINDEWKKKIIFVLQQKDLLNEADLNVNIEGVKTYAQKKGITEPVVFAVSAKQEMEGEKVAGNFGAVRAYITENITGGKAPRLKLINSINTAENINDRIEKGVEIRYAQWVADVDFREDIKKSLIEQEEKSNTQVDILIENLVAAYERLTRQKEQELKQGLSFFSLLKRSLTSIFSKKASIKDWLQELAQNLENDMSTKMDAKLNEGVVNLADSVQQMAKIIDLKIKNSQTILKNDHELFSNIADKRANVLKELQDTFGAFMNQTDSFKDETLFPDKQALSPNLATGSGMAAIGVILMTVTQGMFFDITGGILTTIGVLFAGVSTSSSRRKIITGYRKEVDKGRERIETEISSKLKTYINHLKKRIDANFTSFDELLEKESTTIKTLKDSQQSIHKSLAEMKVDLNREQPREYVEITRQK